MRARIPVLSAGRRRSSGLSRNKSLSAAEEEPRVPPLLLQDMNLCYRLLRHLVPGLPPERAASRVEILQHVIDYILDLETELDSCPARDPGEPQRGELHLCDRQQQLLRRPQGGQSPVVNIQSSESCDVPRIENTVHHHGNRCCTGLWQEEGRTSGGFSFYRHPPVSFRPDFCQN